MARGESANLCPGCSPASPLMMARAEGSSVRRLSLTYTPHQASVLPKPRAVRSNKQLQVQRAPPVLKLPGSSPFSSSSCEQPGGHSCVSLTLLPPATSPGPHRGDALPKSASE